MRLIKSNDFYSLKVRGYVTSLHLRVLDVLYQPLLGFVATTVYRYFEATQDYRKGEPLSFNIVHTHLGFTFDQLSAAISRLEALGLARSFLVPHPEFSEYIIELYAPKDPAAFSQDNLFMHLLTEKVGPRQSQDYLNLFALDVATKNYDDVSSDFASVFAPEFSSISNGTTYENQALKNIVGGVKLQFDRALFLNILVGERLFSVNALSEDEMKTIAEISGIYSLTERATADKVAEYYDSSKKRGSRVDFKAMRKALNEIMKYAEPSKGLRRSYVQKLSGESEKIKLINSMEIMGNSEFLSMLNNGGKNAPADERLIEALSSDYYLSAPVINALVYFTLLNYNDELPRALVEKLASTLGRKKVTTALDTLDALERPKFKTGPVKVVNSDKKPKKETDQTEVLDELDEEILRILRTHL